MLAQPPNVGLVTCQTRAMNTALLPCADADGLPVFNITYRIALRIFKGDKCDDEVAKGFGCEMLGLSIGASPLA